MTTTRAKNVPVHERRERKLEKRRAAAALRKEAAGTLAASSPADGLGAPR
jgi:hypothetical protein